MANDLVPYCHRANVRVPWRPAPLASLLAVLGQLPIKHVRPALDRDPDAEPTALVSYTDDFGVDLVTIVKRKPGERHGTYRRRFLKGSHARDVPGEDRREDGGARRPDREA